MLESFPIQEILKPQTQKFTISCKSFVLRICLPPFFLLHDLCDVPAPLAVVVLLYLETLSWGFWHSCFSGDSSPSTWVTKQFSFFITGCIRGPGPPDLPLTLWKWLWYLTFYHLAQAPPNTCGAGGGEGRFWIFAQLCFQGFTQAGKAASQNCQPELEIARMGKAGKRFHAKICSTKIYQSC